ncbi:MAG: 4-hydroxy-tetrahydrodipicolinate synthase, partial [Coriobacteriia bacterium]|nr:4-hydroxy-tetrahydrodipicolinate synthase [Coriobacteriia bacterium]
TERQFDAGIDGLAVCATTGEAPTLSHDEKRKVFKRTAEIAHYYDKHIVANIGNYNTKESISLAKEAKELGADFLMAVVPYYNKPPQEGLYQHFGAISKATDLPLIMYNIPGRVVIKMHPQTIIDIARDFPLVKGIKQAVDNLDDIPAIVEGTPDDFQVLSGNDDQTVEMMRLGGSGVICTSSNVAPKEMRELVYTAADGNFAEAKKLHDKMLPLMEGLFTTTNPILVKASLELLGYEVGGLRLPLISATDEQRAEIQKVLTSLNLM